MAASGLKAQDVLDAVQTNYSGAQLGQTYVGTRVVNVTCCCRKAPATGPNFRHH
jgi:hypothetical protein